MSSLLQKDAAPLNDAAPDNVLSTTRMRTRSSTRRARLDVTVSHTPSTFGDSASTTSSSTSLSTLPLVKKEAKRERKQEVKEEDMVEIISLSSSTEASSIGSSPSPVMSAALGGRTQMIKTEQNSILQIAPDEILSHGFQKKRSRDDDIDEVDSDGNLDETKIYIDQLPWNASVDDIKKFVKTCGEVVSCDLLHHMPGGRAAIINFATVEAAEACSELSGTLFKDHMIRIRHLEFLISTNVNTILHQGSRVLVQKNQQSGYYNGTITRVHFNSNNAINSIDNMMDKEHDDYTATVAGVSYDIYNYKEGTRETHVPRYLIRTFDYMSTRTEQRIDWNTQSKELDDMFDKTSEEKMKDLPAVDMPKQFVSTLELYPYQKEGIKWLYKQETSPDGNPFYEKRKRFGRETWYCSISKSSQKDEPVPIRGSIIADEMGLGKTVQTLGLILLAPPPNHKYSIPAVESDWEGALVASVPSQESQDPNATTITPQTSCDGSDDDTSDKNVIKADPEEEEEEEGDGKGIPSKQKIQKQTIAVMKGILAEANINLGKNSRAKHAWFFQRIMTGIEEGKVLAKHFPPEMQVSDGPFCTLIVCPPSVIGNWQQQIENHVKEGVLRVAVYVGSKRKNLLPEIENQKIDILLVSYQTLVADYTKVMKFEGNNSNKAKKVKRESIFNINFHRIVLDEAHIIRNKLTKTFKAVTKLDAERRLALTGTPFVNRCDDVYSLMAFLEVEPLNDHDVFSQGISRAIKVGDDLGLSRLRTAMAHIAIRRSKALSGIKLTEKKVEIRSIKFPVNSAHTKVYEAMYGTTRLLFEALLDDIKALKANIFCILEKILRLRQMCLSGELVNKERRDIALNMWAMLQKSKRKLTQEEGVELLEQLSPEALSSKACEGCSAEMTVQDSVILKNCKHIFCKTCISRLAQEKTKECPCCKAPFAKNEIISGKDASSAAKQVKEYAEVKQDMEFETPPKVHALLEAISAMKEGEKGVIFSQFTKFLDVISHSLKEKGYTFVRIDGTVPIIKRVEVIRAFNSDEEDSPTFILCSLHAAGTGINLTRGNHAFMMDCWWNQAVENQAMDRIHRIGQKRNVFVYRFIMKRSIEERMLQLQESKSIQAKGTLEKLNGEEKSKIGISDLKGLLELGDFDEE